ncbi:hypothetical protein LEP1GSC171_3473 [Leptospira santarosai str. HAI1380]|uniref:Uncharacterized protein n=1 Tax=Leptospira santarosai str. ZUN179 TaxID=1049985 RepID=M6UG82_9LEPT|nr:hypothetical protein LEP1GSC175_2718 [Leptospira santarosai str. HAI821]EMO44117.1 hypothetical protein LEP1GSC187_3488 [Leptospira santarosai str. ZUN179]EMP01391.1 hypothetical protein LEP1GSC171_3473 [Leptospira santarosai str. HAI1380]
MTDFINILWGWSFNFHGTKISNRIRSSLSAFVFHRIHDLLSSVSAVFLKIIKLYFLNIKKKLNIRFDKNLNHENIRFLICEIL